jgi:hypothetical protein
MFVGNLPNFAPAFFTRHLAAFIADNITIN